MNVVDYKKRQKKFKYKESFHNETQKTIKHLIITLSIMIVALLITYIAMTNETGQKGYTLEQEKLKNETLKGTNKILETKITNSKISEQIKETSKLQEMIPTEIKQYVTKEDNSVK